MRFFKRKYWNSDTTYFLAKTDDDGNVIKTKNNHTLFHKFTKWSALPIKINVFEQNKEIGIDCENVLPGINVDSSLWYEITEAEIFVDEL